MSRSYRAPYWVDSYGSRYKKIIKRIASKKVRRFWNWGIASGKAYRKVFDPYNIVDWRHHDPGNPKTRRK
jgi:hypothetical protein